MTVRPVNADDWPRIRDLAESLIELHHRWDSSRFVAPTSLAADTYAGRIREELSLGHVMVDVADEHGVVVGFVFAGIEPASWKEQRRRAGYIHDLVVDVRHRHGGIGRALVASAMRWFSERDIQQVLLWSAYGNADAQRLFRAAGFRPTMIEMTIESEEFSTQHSA